MSDYRPLGHITLVDESDHRYVARINEEVELKDGARIRANVFFPRHGGPRWPVLMSSSPYGKDVPLFDATGLESAASNVPNDHRCKHTRFEAPSPAWWCPNGYVLVYHDQRGSSQSPGHLSVFSEQHYDDYAQMITWAAQQSWSTGKVGLTGVSYLALNQWYVAARQPLGLTCIMPWEGLSDLYRDGGRHGGIDINKMQKFWFENAVLPVQYGRGGRHLSGRGPDSPEGNLEETQLSQNRDEWLLMVRRSQYIDDETYRSSNSADFSKIQVPLLSVGNWSGIALHLRGNVIGWMRAASEHKFLRIHTGRHDAPYYHPTRVEMQKSFFDCWLKDDDYGGWKVGKQPPVSFAIRRGETKLDPATGEPTFQYRDELAWPVPSTVYQKLHMTSSKTLNEVPEKLEAATKLSYAGFDGNSLLFETPPATEEYEICGHPFVKLFMSVTGKTSNTAANIDVFLALRKFNAAGKQVFYTSSNGTPQPITLGWIRASHRTVSAKPYAELKDPLPWPTLSHRREDEKAVEIGNIYTLLTELWPTNVVVEKGETLALEISPQDIEEAGLYATEYREKEIFEGTNNLHFGEDCENYLVLPVI